jgi:hypothetical protein
MPQAARSPDNAAAESGAISADSADTAAARPSDPGSILQSGRSGPTELR